jgi:Rieske Fe-S protein
MLVKSDDCVNNEHGVCSGIIKKADLTGRCACPCHDSMYQLVRNTIAVVNQSQHNNLYQFTHESDI